MNVETANLFFALLSLAAAGMALAVVVAVVVARLRPDGQVAILLDDLRPMALWIAFAIAATATLGSLYYSEVANFTPCLLCWYQRIAMYPLAIILGIAAWRRDASIKYYVIPVAAIGAAISIYHYQLEIFPEQGGVCSATVPCNVRWFEVFGFISLAFMALTGFLAIIALLSISRAGAPDDTDDEFGSDPLETDDANV